MDMKDNEDNCSAVAEDDLYWVRARSDSEGIVVAAVWMLCKPKHFTKHSHLYASCNWDSLVCHPQLLGMWIPAKARRLGFRVLDQLLQEIVKRPRPIVFATFSGGFKACLYKLFQVLDDSEGENSAWAKYRLMRSWYAGVIHDSSPVDFVSGIGAHFASHPAILGTKRRNGLLTWSAHSAARALDFFLLPNWEQQRAEMWDMLIKSGEWGPVLIFCSSDDDLAPIVDIETFSSKLSSRGCRVHMTMWAQSTHVAHLRRHPDEYSRAVTAFLAEAASPLKPKLAWNNNGANAIVGVSGSMCRAFEPQGILLSRKLHFHPLNATPEQLQAETSTESKTLGILSRM